MYLKRIIRTLQLFTKLFNLMKVYDIKTRTRTHAKEKKEEISVKKDFFSICLENVRALKIFRLQNYGCF